MTDSTVQVATGQYLDNGQLVQTGGSVVQRQRVSIADDTNVNNHATVDSFGRLITGSLGVTSAQTNPTITTSTTTVLAANSNAKYRLIQNTTGMSCWITIGGSASLNTGMFIGPYGQYEMSQDKGNLDNRVINGISTSGSILFAVLEAV